MVSVAPSSQPASPPAPSPSVIDAVATGLGRSFVDAIVAGDFDRLETLFAPHLRFRAIIPAEYQEASTAAGARALVEDWFGDTDSRLLLGTTADIVGDRLVLGYRLELMDDGKPRIVEQHVSAIVDGALFRDIALLCSGFRPAAGQSNAAGAGGLDSPKDDRAATPALSPAVRLDATGLSCATLTPTISATIRGLDFGAVLEIVTDDPEAEEGLRSWARLTGNELVAVETEAGPARRFDIRRSPRDAAGRKGRH